jgi:hypothetical protein
MNNENSLSRTLEQSGKKFFVKIDQEQKENDKIMKIFACDGKNVWESTKSKK